MTVLAGGGPRGLKPGQLQSGHLGSTCLSEPQMEVKFTQHTQLQHSFNTWTRCTGNFLCAMTTLRGGGVKKSSVGGNLIQCSPGNCQRQVSVCVCTCFELSHNLIYRVHTLVWCQLVFSNISDWEFMCEQACSLGEFFWFRSQDGHLA